MIEFPGFILIDHSVFLPPADLPLTDSDDNPGTSYDNLRKLIHTIVQEVLSLPEVYTQIGNASNTNAHELSTPFEPKKYEDLLATAVLNKVSIQPINGLGIREM